MIRKTLFAWLLLATQLLAVQTVEFPGIQGDTLDLRVLTIGTDTVVHTTSAIAAKTNDATQFAATDVPDSLTGTHRVSAILNGGTDVVFGGYVYLTGNAGTVHHANAYPVALEVWSYTTRTLTQTAAQLQAILQGTTIRWRRGESNTVTLTGLGDVSTYAKLQFTAKETKDTVLDSASEVQLELVQATGTTTLLYIGKGTAGAGETGTITVDDAVAGDLTITLNPAASAKLRTLRKGYYDVQMVTGAGAVTTLTEGLFLPNTDVTRRTD